MNRSNDLGPWGMVAAFLLTAVPLGLALSVTSSCTKPERAIVRSVVDLLDDACADRDSLDDCLGKMQAKRTLQLHAAADGGAK